MGDDTMNGIIQGGGYRPPRIVIYGPSKIGKTTLGSHAPSPIFIPTEDGVSMVKVDQFPVAKVIDTITEAANLCATMVCKDKYANDWGERGFGGYGRGYAETAEIFKTLMVACDYLIKKGITVVMLSQTGNISFKNPVDGDFIKFAPELHKAIWTKVQAWSDVILRADYKFRVKQREKKAVDLNARILSSQGSPSQDAGCRAGYNLPKTIDLSWDAIEKHIGKPESSVIDEVMTLWDLFTEAQAADCLNWLGIKEPKELIGADPGNVKLVLNKVHHIEAQQD
jgi:hypothetical protein